MKKLIAFLLLSLMLIGMTGCGGGGSADYPTAIPSYEQYRDTLELERLAFWTPPITDQHYAWIAESGMSTVVIDAKYDALPGSEPSLQAAALCDKYGINFYIVAHRDGPFDAETVAKYTGFKCFKGLYVDEPLSKSDIDNIANIYKTALSGFDMQDSLRVTLVQGEDKAGLPTYEPQFADDINTYYDYFFEKVGPYIDVVAYDKYPQRGRGTDAWLVDTTLYSIERIAAKAKENNTDFHSYISTMSINSQSVRRPEYDDLMWASLLNLCYGAKGNYYFCYMSPGLPPYGGEFGPLNWAMVNADEEDPNNLEKYYRTDTWYNVQQLNDALTSIDHVYLAYDWVGTMAFHGTQAQTSSGTVIDTATMLLDKHDRIKKVTSTEDTLIGCFKDEQGYDGFMVMNFSDPYFDLADEITIEFNHASKAQVYCFDGSKRIEQLDDGKLNLSLASGEGCFVIPIA